MESLAINGGNPVRNEPFRHYRTIGEEEKAAVLDVLSSGVLSEFLGTWSPGFFGGPKVREFEAAAAHYFGVRHAVTVNSWTSGLVAAVGAIGVEPGDEVIVTPWTMCATATAILHWNAIPVFADIDPQTYNLAPESIEASITPQTKAIVVADIFGLSADMDRIMEIASRNGLKVISDTAQSPGALYKGKFAGTLADVGGYSLNYHKHIHTGEGGILVTNDDDLAERLQLIRNHAEVVVGDKGVMNLSNMIGHNFRLGEIECAIGIEQLKKLQGFIESRQQIADFITEGLCQIDGLVVPHIPEGQTHVYYGFPLQIERGAFPVHRNRICEALRAEGIPVASKYQNLHLLPMFQNKLAYGSKGFPWTSPICQRDVNYDKGICPVAESLNDELYIGLGVSAYDLSIEDAQDYLEAFGKVFGQLEHL